MTSTGTPLVSILIPAYNEPDLLEIALKSAIAQTYSRTEIVICDDSTDDRVKEMLEPYLAEHANIRYFRNEKQLREDNFNRCIERANGEYINFLCHDDRFHPDKIRRMVGWLNLPDVALVTSYRQRIDVAGNPLPDIAATSRLSWVDTIIPNTVLADHCLKHVVNPIGEPTTVLFRKRDLKEPFGYYRGNKYVPINDLATWMQLLAKGRAAYIADPLSSFRQHGGQGQFNPNMIIPAVEQWYRLIRDSRLDGFLRSDEDFRTALIHHRRQCDWIVRMAVDGGHHELLERYRANDVMGEMARLIGEKGS